MLRSQASFNAQPTAQLSFSGEPTANATEFISADRYLVPLEQKVKNPRHKADGMANATEFTSVDRYLVPLEQNKHSLIRIPQP